MKIIIYMKSGNKIIADKVINWKIKYNNDQITSLTIEQKEKGFFKCKNNVIVGSVDLKQIECIVTK
tara:strand:- start:377 stop:574 length:198 start_codon:yes stop_codon:yes gene_type:complete